MFFLQPPRVLRFALAIGICAASLTAGLPQTPTYSLSGSQGRLVTRLLSRSAARKDDSLATGVYSVQAGLPCPLKIDAESRIIKAMFKNIPCAAGCGNGAVSGSELCGLHCADPRKEACRIAADILGRDTILDLNAGRLRFEGYNFSSKHFSGCNFTKAHFKNCLFRESFMRMVFFDGSELIDCDFSNSDLQFLSFGDCVFENCKFNDSELAHLNFNGTSVSASSFDHSNLYNSRFNMAKLVRTSIEDCNLKNVYFFKVEQDGVSFRYSNTKDAFFKMEN